MSGRVFVVRASVAGMLCLALPAASILLAQPAVRRPPVAVPADNPMSDAKVSLGAQLFFDPRLSADGTISCAKCHDPGMAWANHDAVDTGIGGRQGIRNSGSVLDAAYMKFQFWDGRAASLEEQALAPIHNPIEMGETLDHVVTKLDAVAGYRVQFQQVFGTGVTTDGIAKAIAAFERTVVSGPSPYDRYLAGDRSALSPEATRGLALFRGKARCDRCHHDEMLSDQVFHNLGIGFDKPDPDLGREAVTKNPRDRGRFKTPGLRNVALTWPYMHDGSVATLEDVLEIYDKGGVDNPDLDPWMRPLKLTSGEERDLLAFLESLTGTMPRIERPALPR